MLSALLEVAIGLVLVYLVMSIMASAGVELINTLVRRRARDMEYFIAQTLLNKDELKSITNDKSPWWNRLLLGLSLVDGNTETSSIMPASTGPHSKLTAFFSGSLLYSNYPGDYKVGSPKLPYIAASDFVEAVFQSLPWLIDSRAIFDNIQTVINTLDAATGKNDLNASLKKIQDYAQKLVSSDPKDVRERQQTQAAALAEIDIFSKLVEKFIGTGKSDKLDGYIQNLGTPFRIANKMEGLVSLADQLAPDSVLAKVLTTAIDKAKSDLQKTEDDLQKVRENIEKWYNDAMERVTDWFKRRTQLVVLVIGLVIS